VEPTTDQTPTTDRPAPPAGIDPARVLAGLRAGVGIISWASPSLTGRIFGVGDIGDDPRAAVVTRLFGIRELTLAAAAAHPDPTIQRAALKAGVAVDAVDVVATLIAIRKGAPKVIALTFAAGAATFVALGAAGLRARTT